MKLIKYFLSTVLVYWYLSTNAQNIPNGNFEKWHSVPNSFGGEDPDGWTSTNGASEGSNRKGILKSTHSYSGNYALEIGPLISMGTKPYVAAICNGIAPVDWDSFKIDYRKGGTPISYKPVQLKGYYTYQPLVSKRDSAYIIVLLKKYDSIKRKSIVVGKGSLVFSPAKDYSMFSIDIADSAKGIMPDSIVIGFFFQSYTTGFRDTANDLYIDNIFLVHNSGINDPISKEDQRIDIYPTVLPIGNSLNLALHNISEDVYVEIYDISGREFATRQISKFSQNNTVDVSRLSTGVYFCRVSDNHKMLKTVRFIVLDK